jgi:hypothetical protein
MTESCGSLVRGLFEGHQPVVFRLQRLPRHPCLPLIVDRFALPFRVDILGLPIQVDSLDLPFMLEIG